jgi:hypothetical protein
MTRHFDVFVDERGALLPIDLDDLAFAPRRVFVVTGPPQGATRGGHQVECREQVVLVNGRAEVRVDGRVVTLDIPGASALLEPGQTISYELAPGGSTILVLADQPWPEP